MSQDDHESATPVESTPNKRVSAAERARLARRAAYDKAKEQRKKYLATPEVQARMEKQKERLRELRRMKSDKAKEQRKAAHKNEKKAFSEAVAQTRQQKQAARDAELKELIRPALTLIKGGCEA